MSNSSRSKSRPKSVTELREETAEEFSYKSPGKLNIPKLDSTVSGENITKNSLGEVEFYKGDSPTNSPSKKRTSSYVSAKNPQVINFDSDSDSSIEISRSSKIPSVKIESSKSSIKSRNTISPSDYDKSPSKKSSSKSQKEKVLLMDSDFSESDGEFINRNSKMSILEKEANELPRNFESRKSSPSRSQREIISSRDQMSQRDIPRSSRDQMSQRDTPRSSRDQMSQREMSPPRSSRDEISREMYSRKMSPPPRSARDMSQRDMSPPRSSRDQMSQREMSPPRSSRDQMSQREMSPPRSSREQMSQREMIPPRSSREQMSQREMSPPRSSRDQMSQREMIPPRSSREQMSQREMSPPKSPRDQMSQREMSPFRSSREMDQRNFTPQSSTKKSVAPDVRSSHMKSKTTNWQSDSSSDDDDEVVVPRKSTQSSSGLSSRPKELVSDDEEEITPKRESTQSSQDLVSENTDVIETENTENLDNFLIKNNILILNSLVSDGKVVFLKVANYLGQIFLIKTDKSGVLSTRKSNSLSLNKITNAKLIPRSMKVDVSNCAGSAVCGIAFQCDNEFCYLARNDSGEHDEINFKVGNLEQFGEKGTTESERDVAIGEQIGNRVFAYPIVSMAEIEKNSIEAFLVVKEATYKIQTFLSKQIKNGFENLIGNVDVFHKRLIKIQTNVDAMLEFLMDEIKQGTERMKQFDAIPLGTMSVENQQNQKELSEYLLQKHLTYQSIVEVYGKFVADTKKEVSIQQSRSADVFYSGYLSVKENFDEELSSELVKASSWGLPQKFDKMTFSEIVSKKWVDEKNSSVEEKALSDVIVE